MEHGRGGATGRQRVLGSERAEEAEEGQHGWGAGRGSAQVRDGGGPAGAPGFVSTRVWRTALVPRAESRPIRRSSASDCFLCRPSRLSESALACFCSSRSAMRPARGGSGRHRARSGCASDGDGDSARPP
eukprot:3797071-Prymnesium_polylepis.1